MPALDDDPMDIDTSIVADVTRTDGGEITSMVPRMAQILDSYSDLSVEFSKSKGHTHFGLPGTPNELPQFFQEDFTKSKGKSPGNSAEMSLVRQERKEFEVEDFFGSPMDLTDQISPLQIPQSQRNIKNIQESPVVSKLDIPVLDFGPDAFPASQDVKKSPENNRESGFPGFPVPSFSPGVDFSKKKEVINVAENIPVFSSLLKENTTFTEKGEFEIFLRSGGITSKILGEKYLGEKVNSTDIFPSTLIGRGEIEERIPGISPVRKLFSEKKEKNSGRKSFGKDLEVNSTPLKILPPTFPSKSPIPGKFNFKVLFPVKLLLFP